mgnify:CR=1 FL=1
MQLHCHSHHVDTLIQRDSRPNQRYHNGSGSRRGLEENSGKDSYHETSNWVSLISKKLSCTATSHDLRRVPEEIQTKEEEVEEEADQAQSKKDESPLLWGVDTTRLDNFSPSRIHHNISIKVHIPKVNRSSY